MDINNTKVVQNEIHAVLSSSIGPLERVILSSSPPKIQLPAPSSLHRSSRPSTASLIEERKSFLPSSRSVSTSSKGSVSRDSDIGRPEHSRSSSRQSILSSQGSFTSQDFSRLYEMASGSIGISETGENSQQYLDELRRLEDLSPSSEGHGRLEEKPTWSTFMNAYAAGLWNPHRTPDPPRSSGGVGSMSISASSSQSSGKTLTLKGQNVGNATGLGFRNEYEAENGSEKITQRVSAEIVSPENSVSPGGKVSTSAGAAPPPMPVLSLGSLSDPSGSSSLSSMDCVSTSRSTPSTSSTGASSLSAAYLSSASSVMENLENTQDQEQENSNQFTEAVHPQNVAEQYADTADTQLQTSFSHSYVSQSSAPPSSQSYSPPRPGTSTSVYSSQSSSPSPSQSSSQSHQLHPHMRHSGLASARGLASHASHAHMRLPMPPPPLQQHHRVFAVQSPAPPVGLGPHIPLNPLAIFAASSSSPATSPSLSSTYAHTQSQSQSPSLDPSNSASITGLMNPRGFSMHSGPSTPDFTTAAATVRWAASSHVSLAPLAVPSPEHELTDPLRGVNVSVSAEAIESVQPGIRRKKTDAEIQEDFARVAGGRIYKGKEQERRWSRDNPSSREVHHGDTELVAAHSSSSSLTAREEEKQTFSIPHTPLEPIQASPVGSPNRDDSKQYQAESIKQTPQERSTISSVPLEAPSSQEMAGGDHDYFSLGVLPSTRHSRGATSPLLQGSHPPTPSGNVRERHTRASAVEAGSASTPLSSRSLPDQDPSYTLAEQTLRTRASSQDITSTAPEPDTVWSWAPQQQEQQYHSMDRMASTASSFSANSFIPSPPSGSSLSLPSTPLKKGTLNRQSSSPLPAPQGRPEDRPPLPHIQSPRVSSAASASGKTLVGASATRSAQNITSEEESFRENEYLIAPFPFDEAERQRALYKFNILHTAPDPNFDRIAYLAKLVFSTKIVIMSLIDEHEEWYKSESGLGRSYTTRTESIGAHCILQRNDEPTVILDASNDWRFRKHPMVIGSPFVKFCAAAPLRTQEGFSIGTLCVMDDQSRAEFTPRQRHTLKEFAAIAMRELELWRDKIQLRVRDRIQNSMEQFTRECLEIDSETESSGTSSLLRESSMDKVYDRAARLVKKTLDVEDAVVMDVSHFDVLESVESEGSVSLVLHNSDTSNGTSTHIIPAEEYSMFADFFRKFPEGKVAEGIIPQCFRSLLPTRIQHALIVPIFNVDKRPFALLCAYNSTAHAKSFLEGHELSYLRAIGVIILSAVLKRRMILADKSKSLFISNISHELRTPLHGILAAAELLAETSLDYNQASYLQTVQACGTSLVETVNHVLDFTKLSGNSKAGGVENVINPNQVNLAQLVEDAAEGSWIGYRARLTATGEIGTMYSPPKDDYSGPQLVETIIDISYESHGWQLSCEKGGIRRVLMNLIGNSLKFTTSGYIYISLRELPRQKNTSASIVRLELVVEDTGKGISKEFLKNQLFQPFSQENPLQTGTGLGLAIVNSIVRSEGVDGQVDVSSTEGVGTEIRITFNASLPDHETLSIYEHDLGLSSVQAPRTISLQSFDEESRGQKLLQRVISTYLTEWWGFRVVDSDKTPADLTIVNEDIEPVLAAVRNKDVQRIFIIVSSSRGSAQLVAASSAFERMGGFCRIVYKPVGPSRMRQELKACIHALNMRETMQQPTEQSGTSNLSTIISPELGQGKETTANTEYLFRRHSEDAASRYKRPTTVTRANTLHPVMRTMSQQSIETPRQEYPSSPGDTTITLGLGGTLLKSSVGTYEVEGRKRVLVVEDNKILRDLLVRWLMNKGFDFEGAMDGQDGVNKFEQGGRFDVVLLDLSMPNLDGIAATYKIREIEAARKRQFEQNAASINNAPHTAKILALTGMSSLEDKRRAFEAGVDGFMVKPVAFKTLDEMFHQLGISS